MNGCLRDRKEPNIHLTSVIVCSFFICFFYYIHRLVQARRTLTATVFYSTFLALKLSSGLLWTAYGVPL